MSHMVNLTQLSKRDTGFPAFFRYREVGGRVVLTNHEGGWLILSAEEFKSFVAGDVAKETPLYERLKGANFVRAEYDVAAATEALRRRKTFLGGGPNLHIFVVTLRCNETCVYCHSSRVSPDATHTDMTVETAEKAVDRALATTSPALTIEFQGGEPLLNFPVLQRIVEYAKQKNESAGKRLDFTLVSNLALMDEEKFAWLLENRIQICTSIDGPAHLHDSQRKLPTLSAYERTVHWIDRINKAYAELGLNQEVYHVEALLTTTRDTLPLWKEVVDTYVKLGCRALFLRPLDPFGFVEKTGQKVGYPVQEYLAFYRNAVDYMIELNKQGVQILERYASMYLTKILTGEDPNFLDLRNPCGAGIGQVAYNYDGKIYTCDEGRMLHEMGDDTFLIGNVSEGGYRDMLGHTTVRAIALASNLDNQPDCVHCAYNPYCGTCPVHSHKTQGTFFGRMRESTLCAVLKGIQDYLFEKIGEGDPAVQEVFRKWTTVRDRSHFVQLPAVGTTLTA